mmetsp:Transcript_13211/g.28684  ORF Transcript_13211/g.28684 Transcript_13211/m.28684 type:complete len:159 (+) Transcript_13211:231-707(+)
MAGGQGAVVAQRWTICEAGSNPSSHKFFPSAHVSSTPQVDYLYLFILLTKMASEPCRLYVSGAILGYKRGLRNQHNSTSLIKINGVDAKEDVDFYLGKRVAYITKASAEKNGTKFRVNWGRVCRAHGSNGVVRCKFNRDLPPQSIGGRVRIMLYPSRV